MPFITENTRPGSWSTSSADYDDHLAFDVQDIVSDSEYPGTSFPGNSESL